MTSNANSYWSFLWLMGFYFNLQLQMVNNKLLFKIPTEKKTCLSPVKNLFFPNSVED